MANYEMIDLMTWPRRSHWNYYRNIVKAVISMTCKIDVTDLKSYCKEKKVAFSPILLYAISKTVNSLDCMKMFADQDGNPGIWKEVHPNFTIFHEDDETFSDVWMEYFPELDKFVANYQKVLEIYKDKHGIKVRDGQPANFFPVSGIPWASYESFQSATPCGEPMLFPVINYGKYEEVNERLMMPVSVTIAHAAMDGYHVSRFFEQLQENVNGVSKKR